MKTAAIVLSAGSGKRMGTDVPKQYLALNDKPVIYYSLKAFEDSIIDEIILVVGDGYEQYCKKEIIDKYGLKKVSAVVPGGKERYDSVYNGITATDADYVFIHDGARPFVNPSMIKRGFDRVLETKACIAAMPVKDTIKSVDTNSVVTGTPERNSLYQVQTPQIFERGLLVSAYAKMESDKGCKSITDDAMIIEKYTDTKVCVFDGAYSNIKITTAEDMVIAKALLDSMEKR